MIEVNTAPIPPTGRVTVRTAVRPRGAAITAVPLGDSARARDVQRTASALELAREEGRAEATGTAARALYAAAERLDEARERAEQALSSDAVQLGVEIARQILKLEIQAANYDLEAIVRATLAASEIKRGRCVIHVHPEDAAMLQDVIFRDETVLASDAEIERGTVLVETPRGLLVREPTAALEEIREQLLEDLVR